MKRHNCEWVRIFRKASFPLSFKFVEHMTHMNEQKAFWKLHNAHKEKFPPFSHVLVCYYDYELSIVENRIKWGRNEDFLSPPNLLTFSYRKITLEMVTACTRTNGFLSQFSEFSLVLASEKLPSLSFQAPLREEMKNWRQCSMLFGPKQKR